MFAKYVYTYHALSPIYTNLHYYHDFFLVTLKENPIKLHYYKDNETLIHRSRLSPILLVSDFLLRFKLVFSFRIIIMFWTIGLSLPFTSWYHVVVYHRAMLIKFNPLALTYVRWPRVGL